MPVRARPARPRVRLLVAAAAVAATALTGLVAPSAAVAAPAGPAGTTTAALPRSAELSETSRLPARRTAVIADRFYSMGTADGLYPAMGFHTRGEMGGFWSQPIKLLDGVWFGVDGGWLGGDVRAARFTSGWGYTRIAYAGRGGVRVARTDVAANGNRAGLIGLTLTGAPGRTVRLTMDAHSELMKVYPWGETKPGQLDYNLPDTGAYRDGALVFREQGTPKVRNAERHDYAATVASTLTPTASSLGRDFRGPQDPAVVCPASGPDAPEQPARCDDTAYGRGTGGQLAYRVRLGAKPTTVWFAVGGSDHGPAKATAAMRAALADPVGVLRDRIAARQAIARNTALDLPGDRRLQDSVAWSKQNLSDSVQEAYGLRLRPTNAGTKYPKPVGTLAKAHWIGAGFPDYPWIFGTDGEYTAFASVAMGQFADIEGHLRTLQRVSDVVNKRSGKVVHEVTPDGQVYFGANADAGNTDETAKFPSAVALVWRWTGDDAFRDEMYGFTVRNMKYVYRELDADGDGWPEGLGNVEVPGMGVEKLDNTVYTIRGLRDLADLARSKGDAATVRWADGRASKLEKRFEDAWWYGKGARQYADSLDDPDTAANDNTKILQRHWIGVTPMDALLVRPGQVTRPLASQAHGVTALEQRQRACYSGTYGLYHTGTGPTSAEGGNPGPSCDTVVSSVASLRSVFTLNTGIMAVAEGNFGRLGRDEQQRYTTANARVQLDPKVWEMPGAMPEISPSPDFGANIDKLYTERSMVLQAWGAYGTLWPVVSQQLGVQPDLGRGRVAVVSQLPDGQSRIGGKHVRLGRGWVDVTATAAGKRLTTTVANRSGAALTLGHVVPAGAKVAAVTVDGHAARYRLVWTARGYEVRTGALGTSGTHTLAVRLR